MPFTDSEKSCVKDLLLDNEGNSYIFKQLAKSVTKNVCEIKSNEDALSYIYTHIDDVTTLLNKRLITKEVLFKYLHNRSISVGSSFTKNMLIEKILDFWKSAENDSMEDCENESETSAHTETFQYNQMNTFVANTNAPNPFTPTMMPYVGNLPEPPTEDQFPINLLARTFSEWFFQRFNESKLEPQDFYSDAQLLLRMAGSGTCTEEKYQGLEAVMHHLLATNMHYGFHYNPNLTHQGVQGRMDTYGCVLVIACGTLHTQENAVGVFECTLGILRDPFAENNWKLKSIRLMLRSQYVQQAPSLYESDTLMDTLALAVPTGEIT